MGHRTSPRMSENAKLMWWIAFFLAILVVFAYWPHPSKEKKQPDPAAGLQGPIGP